MSAFRCKADITIAACLLLRSLLGVKRTSLVAVRMSANDPKRTSPLSEHLQQLLRSNRSSLGVNNEATRIHYVAGRDGHRITCRLSADIAQRLSPRHGHAGNAAGREQSWRPDFGSGAR